MATSQRCAETAAGLHHGMLEVQMGTCLQEGPARLSSMCMPGQVNIPLGDPCKAALP